MVQYSLSSHALNNIVSRESEEAHLMRHIKYVAIEDGHISIEIRGNLNFHYKGVRKHKAVGLGIIEKD